MTVKEYLEQVDVLLKADPNDAASNAKLIELLENWTIPALNDETYEVRQMIRLPPKAGRSV